MSSDTDLGDSSIEYLGDSSIDVSVPDNTMDYSFIIENDALVRGHAGDTDMGDSNNSSLSRCESDFNDCEDDSLIVDTDGEDTFIPSRILSSSTPVKRVHNGELISIIQLVSPLFIHSFKFLHRVLTRCLVFKRFNHLFFVFVFFLSLFLCTLSQIDSRATVFI